MSLVVSAMRPQDLVGRGTRCILRGQCLTSSHLITDTSTSSNHVESFTIRPSLVLLTKEVARSSTMASQEEEKEEIPQPVDNSDTPQDEPAQRSATLEIGTSATVMRLWEDTSCTDRIKWLTEPPKIETEEKPISESPQYAITLQHRSLKACGKQSRSTIVIRCPELRKLLEETIPDIQGLYNEAEHGICIRTPFRLLFWYLDYINEAAEGPNPTLSKTAKLLKDVLDEEFRSLIITRNAMVAQKEINFNTLWTLFKPGITCLTNYAIDFNVAVKCVSIHYSTDPMGKLYYRVKYDLLAWNGDHLGWQDSYTDIMEFSGRRKISSLEILPIEFCKDCGIVDQFVSRGKRFMSLVVKEPYMMSFSGETLDRESSPMWWQGEQKKSVSLDFHHEFRC